MWHCHCFGVGSIPGPELLHAVSVTKKKKKKKGKTVPLDHLYLRDCDTLYDTDISPSDAVFSQPALVIEHPTLFI